MSNEATTWAWMQTVDTPVRKLLLLHLADSASRETGFLSWYSLSKIAKRCNCSKSTASSNLKQLAETGYIVLVRKGTRGGGTNCYRVNVGTVSVQDGPGQPIPVAELSIPADELSPVPGDELAIPAAEPSIPGAGSINVKNRKLNKNTKGQKPVPDDFRESVLEAYHEFLPNHVRVTRWDESQDRAKRLSQIYYSEPMTRDPDFWKTYFSEAALDDWWTGRKKAQDGGQFFAEFEFLIRKKQFDKIVERGVDRDRKCSNVA